MLQWMGGSRKKVATSRKSIQKRQRQYFEQRRRQQQQREATFVEGNVDGLRTFDHQKGCRSLDILNLHSFSKTTEECRPKSDNEKMSTMVNKALHERSSDVEDSKHYIPSKDAPTTLTTDNSVPTETRIPSSHQRSAMSPESFGASSTQISTSNVRNPDSGCLKYATSTQYSILDLIGDDDGATGTSEGNPEYEAHVAFSIKGLGNMGTETPLQSPKRPGRRMSRDRSSYTKAFKKLHPVKSFNAMLDDLGIETEYLVEDTKKTPHVDRIDPFLTSEDIHYPLSYADHEASSLEDGLHPDRKRYQMNYLHEQDGHFNLCNASSHFLDDDESDYKSGSHWRNVNATKHSYSWGNDVPDLKFDSYKLPLRYQKEMTDNFNILDEGDCRFRSVDEPNRYSSFMRNYIPHAGYPSSQMPWDDPRDTFTTLSEESCSSSAARGKSIADVPSGGCRKGFVKDLQSPLQSSANDYYDKDTQNRMAGSMRQGEDSNRSRIYTRSNISHLNPLFSSPATFNEKLANNDSWLREEGLPFSNMNTDPGISFRQSSCEKSRHRERDLLYDDTEADLLHDTECCFSRIEKDALNEFPSEKPAFCQPFSSKQSFNNSCFPKAGCGESWPSVHCDSEIHVQSLRSFGDADSFGEIESTTPISDLSARGSVTVEGGDKPKSHPPTDEKVVQVPIGNKNIMPESRPHGDGYLKGAMAYSSDGDAKGTSFVMKPNESDSKLIAREVQESVLAQHQQDSKASKGDAVGLAGRHKVVAESCEGPNLKIVSTKQSGQVMMVERYVLQLLCLAKRETVIQDATKNLL